MEQLYEHLGAIVTLVTIVLSWMKIKQGIDDIKQSIINNNAKLKHVDEYVKDIHETLFGDRNKTMNGLVHVIKDMDKRIIILHDWHDQSDPEEPTSKIWYFTPKIKKAMLELLAELKNGKHKNKPDNGEF